MNVAATQPGVEEVNDEVIEQPVNPRLSEIERLAQKVQEDRDAEMEANGEPVVDTRGEEVKEAEEEKAETAEESPVAEVKPAEAHAEELITIKVDGETRQISKDKIFEAGLRTVQKESAADRRLDEATRLLKEVQQRIAPVQEQQPRPSQEWDDGVIVYALQHGNEEEKTEAIRQLRGRDKEVATPEQIAAIAEAKVLDRVDFANTVEWFEREYKDVRSDPYLFQLAAVKEDQMRASGDTRSRREVFKEIGDELRKWKGGAVAVQSLDAKREQKATITNLPAASVRKQAPEMKKPETPSDIVARMAKARGQAA